MDYIIELLQDNAIISNVISIVVLGVLGIITTFIKNSISSINTEQAKILAAKSSLERVDKVADLVERTATLYKDAVLGSNLSAATKTKVLEDYASIQDAYKHFLTAKVPVEVKPVLVKEAEKTSAAIEKAVVNAGQDVLSKLREQLEKK